MNRRNAWRNLALSVVVQVVGATAVFAVDVWVTAGDKSQLFKQQTDMLFQSGSGSGGTLISVVPTTTYQAIEGFGAAMTDSSAWLLQNEMTTAQRDKLMRQVFSREAGIGLNYLRVPIGASDFTASGFYTYNDNPPTGTDEFQQYFSINHDTAYIIPRLQQALSLNPELKLMGSPWSPPAWMKTNNSLIGGSLATQWEAAFARYLTKFIQAYEAEGLPIDAITLQNEPLNSSNYPTMLMQASQQARVIKNQLGPLLAAENIDTKIVAYDHNWDNTTFPLDVLNDAAARQYVAGTAFHAYAGTVSAQTTVHNAYPDKGIYFTEISGGEWATNFADNLVWYLQNIFINNTRSWGQTGLMWNLALDQNHGPHLNGCTNCRGVVTINNVTGAVTFNEEFYSIAHFTKVIQPGAVRIGSTFTSSINNVAFLNPDGSRVLVVLNPGTTSSTARINENGQYFNYSIPAKSVATFYWNNSGADFDNGGFDDGGFHQGGGSLDAWTPFGNTVGNVSAANQAVLAGDKSLKLFGQSIAGSNVSGVSQGITVAAGEQLIARLNAFVRSAETIAGTSNVAQMKIEYYNQHGGVFGSANFLGEDTLLVADAMTPNDVWQVRQLNSVAPAGAIEARLVLRFLQPNNQAGAVHLDSVAFGLASSLAIAGDYDANGIVDGADYAVWRSSLGSTTQLQADGNGNGAVDAADYVVWRNRHATGLGLGATSALLVPEPSGLLLALGGILGFVAYPVHFGSKQPAGTPVEDVSAPSISPATDHRHALNH